MATDPYVYPGTTVLKNLAGIEDHDRLQQFEAVSTADRISELSFKPIAGPFDIDHLQRIHLHIFQDVYAWAGQFRTVDIRIEGEFWFCRHEFIATTLLDLLNKMRGESTLRNLTPQQFGERAGYYLSELNAIHPFREGNGRTQREFIRELGLNAGLDVDWRRVTAAEMRAASVAGFQEGDSQPMGNLIAKITTATRSE
jgi:cell filamentation protein